MLSCLYIASALFLTDGRTMLRFDNVRSFNVSFTGTLLEAKLDDGEVQRFQIPPDWKSGGPENIVLTCEAEAQLKLTS